MKEIIVISFEEINAEKVVNLFLEFKLNSILLNYQIAADTDENTLDFKSNSGILNIINSNLGCSLYFNFSNFNLNGLTLSWLGFQIYKYDKKIDLNIDFEDEFVNVIHVISYIQDWTILLSSYLEAKAYYCGYEPILDIERQFFTSITL
jgi:hypothetical protein